MVMLVLLFLVAMTMAVMIIMMTSSVPIITVTTATAMTTIFSTPYKVHRLGAGIVFMAVLAPFLRMAGRNIHVNRRGRTRLAHNHDGLLVDDRWRRIADIDTAIDARADFAGNSDAYIDIVRMGGRQTQREYGG